MEISLVDDDKTALNLLQLEVNKMGHVVTVCADAGEAAGSTSKWSNTYALLRIHRAGQGRLAGLAFQFNGL